VDAATGTLIGGVAIAVITYILNPWIRSVLKKQRENDPQQGWRSYVEDLTKRVAALEAENLKLEEKVGVLTAQIDDKTGIINRQESVIAEQSSLITAQNNWIASLLTFIRSSKLDPPLMDPAVAYWLRRAEGGKQ
jgi:peptidoglycan hydrolase CwlO-like protein